MSEKERPQLIIDYEANTDKLVRLGDVVDQFKGKAVPAKAEPGEFAVINLSDMTPNGIAYDDLKTFSEERRKLLRFLLEDGDVLIASKGTVQKVAVFEDQGKREVVASSNITVLRPKEKLRGFYIKFFLETEIGRAYLDYADKGKAVLNLSTADLLDIKIPEIPIVKQDYQIAAYLRGRADFHRKMVRAQQEWKNIQHNVTEALFGYKPKASKLGFVGLFLLFSCIMVVANMLLGGHYDYQHHRFITTSRNNHKRASRG